jgi:hypothetical protein
MLEIGKMYLTPSDRLARLTTINHFGVNLKYQEGADEVTLTREFAETHLVLAPESVQ